MADDINVVFRADTSQLDAAVSKVKSEMQSLTPGAPGSGILTSLPAAFGGAPSTLLERATAAAKANAAAAAQAGTAMKNYGLELEETGAKAERAGMDFGRMAERIGSRLVIFEAIRLAIQGIKYAFDQISNLQQARIQFDAMSDSTDHLAARFEYLKEGADAAFTEIGKAVQVRNALMDLGASETTAALATRDLDQWSKILGIDAVKLAEALGRVAQGEGSLADMRLVTRMMGDQSEAGRQLIQTYEDLIKAQKRLEAESAAAAKSMDAVLRATEQMGEKMQRQLERRLSLMEKVANAQAEWDRKNAGGTQSGTEMMTQAFIRAEAGIPQGGETQTEAMGRLLKGGKQMAPEGPPISEAMRNEFERGVIELSKEMGSMKQVYRLLGDGTLSYRDAMEAAKQATDDQLRTLREDEAANRLHAESLKETAASRVSGAKADFAKLGPQAVTAPPAQLWEAFKESNKGQIDALKTAFDAGIEKFIKEIGNVTKAADGTTAEIGRLEEIFRSG